MGATCEVILVGMSLVQPTDIHRFPPGEYLQHVEKVYQQRVEYCQLQQTMHFRHQYWFWQDRINELNRWHDAWSALHEAWAAYGAMQGNDEAVQSLEDALEHLRTVIGEANYAAGQMPMMPR